MIYKIYSILSSISIVIIIFMDALILIKYVNKFIMPLLNKNTFHFGFALCDNFFLLDVREISRDY